MSSPRSVRVDVVEDDAAALSWWLPPGASTQHGYRIRTADGYDSGDVLSPVQTFVVVAGSGASRRSTSARVRVTTELGVSEWSDPAPIAGGLPAEPDWAARWIGVPEPSRPPKGDRPAYWLRTAFDAGEAGTEGVDARLHVSALGVYEAFVNGVRVGADELSPGYTQYRVRVTGQTYGVQLRPGRNVVAVLLADGWFRGQVGLPRAADQFGTDLALRLQLQTPDSAVLVASGAGWRTSPSHVLAADLIGGQREDRRLVDQAVHRVDYDDTHWADAVPRDVDVAVVAPVAPPIRRVEEIAPVAVTHGPDGASIVDLGQNINGRLRLRDLGPAGTTLTLRHGEHLDASGELTTSHLDVDLPILPEPLPLGQVDQVVSAGIDGDVFEPRFTTHGFRYARIEGHPAPLRVDDVTGVVVHSDLRRTGWFSCSDDRLTRLHDAAVWSLRGNICGIPTDCPQRERAGWVGDWQVFAPTAAYLYDVLGFSRSWLRDVALDQRADGCVANMSPCPPGEGFDGPLGALNGSAGWGDAVVSVPWDLYQAYGDVSLLRETWPTASRWVDYAIGRAANGRHPARAEARPQAAEHEKYLWDKDFHWGEWLEPDVDLHDFGAFVAADKSEVATAYLCRSAATVAAIGALIDAPADAVLRFQQAADGARRAWQAEFLTPGGALRTDTQAAHVRALAFGLVPDDVRPLVARRLVDLVAEAGGHLRTGFLSTGLLLPTLADAGQIATAYQLLLQDTEPSWLTMIERGATTVWERWNGVDADGVAHESLNHYSKGAVISFLHRYTAGLTPTSPGYRTFAVHPRPGGGLTWARAHHDCPYGPITVDWRLEPDALVVDVEVPGGTVAELRLPGAAPETLRPGTYRRRGPGGVTPGPATGSSGPPECRRAR